MKEEQLANPDRSFSKAADDVQLYACKPFHFSEITFHSLLYDLYDAIPSADMLGHDDMLSL